MPETLQPGKRTGVRVQIPPDRLDSAHIFSRQALRLPPEDVRGWNERNRRLLDLYGLEVASVMRMPVPGGGGKEAAAPAALQGELRDRLLMAAMLGALAVSASGRGDLLAIPPAQRDRRKQAVKENNDRNATAAIAEALFAMTSGGSGASIHVAIGEGARKKPGEKGGNPTLYAGQSIGRGPKRYSLAVDTVEGTSKSTLFDPSCGTLLFITEAEIAPVPDVYFDKCQLAGIDQVGVADPLDRIVAAVMEGRATREINLFALDRPRHPIEAMRQMGANMRIDTDGDAYPVVASGLRWGVFADNLRPLDGVAGNIGGAAEMIASAAGGHYLGVRSTARFCASRIKRWEERYDLSAEDEAGIRARGMDPARVYRIEDLVPGLASCDGAFVAAAISENWHIPGLNAAFVGGNFATVNALFVGAAGTADLYGVVFAYRQPYEETVRRITPVLTRLLSRAALDIPSQVRAALADPASARRLRHEVATSFYSHMEPSAAEHDGEAKARLDLASAAKVETPEAMAVLRTLAEAAPDWFA